MGKMDFPRGRELVLGIGAGIAAYKSCELLRRLQDHGFLITAVPTPTSLNFVGKATWEALSGRPVKTDLWSGEGHVSHVEIADRADIIVIAPATADLIARIALGRADDLLTTTVLATSAPIIVVPAMHPGMWLNPATVANVATLRERGFYVMEPDVGRLTGKDSGIGRFPESSAIISQIKSVIPISDALKDRKILVTAGGTREPIDPVRFIGNRSSGRQGLAIAYEALRSGADVTVVAGDTDDFDLEGAKVLKVSSANEMLDALKSEMPHHDVLVMAAAVADARVEKVSDTKIKKDSLQSISLERNPDLLATIAKTRRADQVLVGFAAETSTDFEAIGQEKLRAKGVDFLYVTNVSGGAVFGEDVTSGALLTQERTITRYDRASKFTMAKDLVSVIAKSLEEKNG